MQKTLLLFLSGLSLIGVNVFAFDVTIDQNANITTDAPGATGHLEVTGGSAEKAIVGIGDGTGGAGVYGVHQTNGDFGLLGGYNLQMNPVGVYGYSFNNWAGYFEGDVNITGNLSIDGDITIPVPLNLSMTAGGYTIHGINGYAQGIGVRGDGGQMGVWGNSGTSTGIGVYGEATASSDVNYGVYGYTTSSTGYAIYGKNEVQGGHAGYFDGSVTSTETITAIGFTGNGSNLTNLNWTNLTGVPAGFADGLDGDCDGMPCELTSSIISDCTKVGANSSGELICSTDPPPVWSTNGADIYYNSGKVGIGTSSPMFKLELGSATDLENYLRVNSSDWSGVRFFDGEGSHSGGISYVHPSDYLVFQTRSSTGVGEKMRITSDGDVGIGITSPGAKLDVQTGAGFAVKGANTSGGNYGTLGGDSEGVLGYSANPLQYGVYGKHLLAIDDTPAVYGEHAVSDNYGIGVKGKGGHIGVVGESSGIGSSTYTGLYGDVFKAGALGTGTTRGVYGYATGGETNYGGYFETGNAWGTGIGLYATGGNYAAMFRGNVQIQNSSGTTVMEFGDVGNYAAMFRGNVQIQNSSGITVMELGEGLDYAEGFDVSEPSHLSAGTVLVIDPDNSGKLMVSSTAYDTKVAGIVAGANGLGSGVRLGADQFDSDVALAGRVYCNVDASETGIQPGDLLTTSSMVGYAMKATDYDRAQGAILGKAMENLEKGKIGQILVLVTLQ